MLNYKKIIAISMHDSLYSIFIRVFFKNYSYIKEANKRKESTITFFNTTYSYGRTDYDNMVDFIKLVMNDLNIKYTMVNVFEVRSLKGILFKLSVFLNLFFSGVFNKKINLKMNLLMAKIEYDKGILESILYEENGEHIITFCDAHYVDSLVTQLSKKSNKKTYTLQHGQYEIQTLIERPENYALLNLESDYLLSWGRATVDEYINKVGGDCLIIPLGICSGVFFKQEFSIIKEIKKIKLYLDSDKNYLSNLEMIRIVVDFCKKYSLSYEVFFHPMSDRTLYDIEYNIISHCDKKNEINVMLSSGIIVKKMVSGENVILFHNNDNIFSSSFCSFSNSDNIENLFKSIKEEPEKYLDQLIKAREYFLACGDSYDNYKKFFINEFVDN